MALLLPSQEEVEEAVEGFPVGFRFRPTDLDLVDFYLRNRKQGCPNPELFIQELDIYKFRPWNLPHFLFPYRSEDWEMYFFTKRRRAGKKSKSVSRTVDEGGVWDCHAKETQVYKQVVVQGDKQQLQNISVKIGCSLQFNFKLFEPGDKKRNKVRTAWIMHRTAWIMHEYRLFESADDNNKFDELVLCKISKKRGEKGEEEEEEEEDVIAPLNIQQMVDEVLAVQTSSPLQCLMEGSSEEAFIRRGCGKRKRVEVEEAADDDADYFAAIESLEECMKGADQNAAASLMPPKEEIQETMPVGAAANGDVGDELFSTEDVEFEIDADLCCRVWDECLQDDFLMAIGQDDHK